MQIDSSIPLQVQQPQFMTPMQAQGNAQSMQQQMQSTQLGQMQLAAGQRNMRNQLLLSQIGAKPGAIDKDTGFWSDDSIKEITGVDPLLGQNLLQGQTKAKMAVSQLALERDKGLVEQHKAKSDAINDEQLDAISASDAAPASQRDEVYAKKWAEGRERLKKTGLFPDDTQFADMNYKQAKEIAMRRGKVEKNQVQQVEDARDVINDLKEEFTHANPNSPQAKQLLQKISDGEKALKRMTAPTAPMINLGGKPPSGFRWSATNPGELEAITGGPADTKVRPRRDVEQADALAAYRALYPMGHMPEVYGKDQPTPEEYVAKYIKDKESGGKGTAKQDEITKRFSADAAMKNYTIGKQTPQGYEVLDKSGKLVGHYQ